MRGIRIGLGIVDSGANERSLGRVLEKIRAAETAGFQSVWIPNAFGLDALTVCAVAGRETETLELGAAVIPTHSRHPVYTAQQTLSTAAACGGRFVLGLGPSHAVVVEEMLGLSYARPARHVREYVSIVNELLRTGKVTFRGELYRVRASLEGVTDAACPVLIGGLGPRMRRIAGGLADGTVTWMAGPRTLGEQIVPDVVAAAERAGRQPPRIVAGFPVVLTDDPSAAREDAARTFAMYGSLPSYRAMLDAEGARSPGDVILAGDESGLEAAIRELASAGVTDLNAAAFGFGPNRKILRERTREFLADLARQ